MPRQTASASDWLLFVLVQIWCAAAALGLALGIEPDSPGRLLSSGPFKRDEETPSPKKNGAMVVLYAVTGVVSGIFCIVIISGAIRAIRHPERYGPRRGDNVGATPQTRTQGLTRAILDTFPVIPFRSNTSPAPDGQNSERKDSSADEDDDKWHVVEMAELGHAEASSSGARRDGTFSSVDTTKSALASEYGFGREGEDARREPADGAGGSVPPPPPPPASESPRSRARPAQAPTEDPVMPDAIGRETCPICIVDFEEGEAVRVLPCNGAHRFHKECVDPWLLELSSSCPICRQDFAALETMITSDAPDDGPLAPPQPTFSSGARSSFGRFSRYVRIARHRSQRRQQQQELSEFGVTRDASVEREGHGSTSRSRERREERRWRTGRRPSRSPAPDPTDPPMPVVEHTTL
jgi:hypothetical protein